MFIEGLCDLLNRRTQGLAGTRRRLPLGVGNAKALLQPLEREIARHARRLHLLPPVRDHEPLALCERRYDAHHADGGADDAGASHTVYPTPKPTDDTRRRRDAGVRSRRRVYDSAPCH